MSGARHPRDGPSRHRTPNSASAGLACAIQTAFPRSPLTAVSSGVGKRRPSLAAGIEACLGSRPPVGFRRKPAGLHARLTVVGQRARVACHTTRKHDDQEACLVETRLRPSTPIHHMFVPPQHALSVSEILEPCWGRHHWSDWSTIRRARRREARRSMRSASGRRSVETSPRR